MNKKCIKLNAFTLAEVLITLAIIGVVAALTISPTIKDYRRHQVEAALKKNYSVLSQALIRAQTDYGQMSTWDEFQQDYIQEKDSFDFTEKYVIPYLKLISYEKKSLKNMNYDKNMSYLTVNHLGYILHLADGTIYVIHSYGPSQYIEHNTLIYSYVGFIEVMVDINGYKKPNQGGKDIFFFQYPVSGKTIEAFGETNVNIDKSIDNYVNKTGLNPNSKDDRRNASINMKQVVRDTLSTEKLKQHCYDSAKGYCAGVIKRNGWKIPDDYPWL